MFLGKLTLFRFSFRVGVGLGSVSGSLY
jgi:hypothetical protein